MTSNRRNQWFNVVGENKKAIIYWTHRCGGVLVSTPDKKVCPNCGMSEEEYGRLKSERCTRGVSST